MRRKALKVSKRSIAVGVGSDVGEHKSRFVVWVRSRKVAGRSVLVVGGRWLVELRRKERRRRGNLVVGGWVCGCRWLVASLRRGGVFSLYFQWEGAL